MVLKKDAWSIVQAEADAMPPYLSDDELTIERFHEKNADKMTKNEARDLLNRLSQPDGPLEKQERRRKGKSGSHVIVYVAKGKE
jgi:hypothetical protein